MTVIKHAGADVSHDQVGGAPPGLPNHPVVARAFIGHFRIRVRVLRHYLASVVKFSPRAAMMRR
jgi:hypothetical protein